MRKISIYALSLVLLMTTGATISAYASRSLQQYSELLSEKVQDKESFGHTAKLDLMRIGVVFLDGRGEQNQVSNDDQEAEVTLVMSSDTLDLLIDKKISAVKAALGGLIKVEGDRALAIKLATLLEMFGK